MRFSCARIFFEILECARELTFCIKLKTNAVLIREAQAVRLRDLGVESIQVSIYSHRPEVHDAITKVPGSLQRSIKAIRFLKSQGLKVIIANVLMTENLHDYQGVRALADELGTECTLDPTVTPKMDGDRSILELNAGEAALRRLFRDETLVGNADEFCAPPTAPDEESMESLPCSAGHTAAYVSPYGEFYPCVQFPLSCGNVRQQRFIDIWRDSEQLKEVRSIRLRDLSGCSQCAHGSTCTRCPGWRSWKGICVALPPRTVRNPLPEPEFHLPICWRRERTGRFPSRAWCKFKISLLSLTPACTVLAPPSRIEFRLSVA